MFWFFLAALAADPAPFDARSAQASCDAGDADVCTALGARYLQGDGVPVDRFRASQLFRTACAADHAHGCMFLAEAYRKGEGAGADQAKATDLYIQACELGDALACRSVGDLFILGNMGRTDGRTAGLWYQMGCDLGDGQACTAAGLWMERGDVMDADPKKAVELFRRGCEGGHPRGCTLIGIRSSKGAGGLKRDLQAAADWFLRACPDDAESDPEGCRELGMLMVKGKGVVENREAGRDRLERACFRNDAIACRELAEVEQGEGRLDEAMFAAQRGCDLGDAAACRRQDKVRYKMALEAGR